MNDPTLDESGIATGGGPPLRKLRVQGFGPLRDVSIEFAPLTVLVGPNDSGKTQILRVIEELARAHEGRQGWASLFPNPRAFQERTFKGGGQIIRFDCSGFIGEAYDYGMEIHLEDGRLGVKKETYATDSWSVLREAGSRGRLSLTGNSEPVELSYGSFDLVPITRRGSAPSNTPLEPFRSVTTRLYQEGMPWFSARRFRLLPERLKEPVPVLRAPAYAEEYDAYPPSPGAMPSVESDGFGFSHVVAEICLRYREHLNRIMSLVSEALPMVRSLGARHVELPDPAQRDVQQKAYLLEVVSADGTRIDAPWISDGVVLMMAYAVLAMFSERPSILLIEEPESGLHPGVLRTLLQLLQDLSAGKGGGAPVQVVVTTHSPLLLNYVDPACIRVAVRDSETGTRVFPMSAVPEIERLLEYQGPGELWANLGENGLSQRGR